MSNREWIETFRYYWRRTTLPRQIHRSPGSNWLRSCSCLCKATNSPEPREGARSLRLCFLLLRRKSRRRIRETLPESELKKTAEKPNIWYSTTSSVEAGLPGRASLYFAAALYHGTVKSGGDERPCARGRCGRFFLHEGRKISN